MRKTIAFALFFISISGCRWNGGGVRDTLLVNQSQVSKSLVEKPTEIHIPFSEYRNPEQNAPIISSGNNIIGKDKDAKKLENNESEGKLSKPQIAPSSFAYTST